MDRLATYVAAWAQCADDVEALLASLDDTDWARETDCPGWTVRDVVAHLAAMESELAGGPGPDVEMEVGTREVAPAYTRAGVAARRDRSPAELVEELTGAVRRRRADLDADPPSDPAATPSRLPGGLGWDWQTLLRNRVVDLWVHEQDIRRAADRPGGLDSPGARVTAETFAGALPFVIGKRAGAPPGTTVVVRVGDRETAYAVDSDGRCRPVEQAPAEPTVHLALDLETFTLLGAGRRDPLLVDAGVSGDRELGERILQAMPVTP